MGDWLKLTPAGILGYPKSASQTSKTSKKTYFHLHLISRALDVDGKQDVVLSLSLWFTKDWLRSSGLTLGLFTTWVITLAWLTLNFNHSSQRLTAMMGSALNKRTCTVRRRASEFDNIWKMCMGLIQKGGIEEVLVERGNDKFCVFVCIHIFS